MAGIKDISSVWKNIKEIDLKPIRDAATHPVRIALVGRQGAGRHTLAEQMHTDPARPGVHTQSPLILVSVDASIEVPLAHLIIVIVDAKSKDFSPEQLLVKKWSEAGKNILVFINKIDMVENEIVGDLQQGWQTTRVLSGSVKDTPYLQREFIPTVLELLPQQHLALGRQFPLFRIPIARQIINDTCFSNAAYSFSTGLAEIVPVLDIPLNVTDMIVLTKSQAFLAYKLGLLVGFSTRWQDYVTEFGGVIGGGFLWRQIARQLIGLIPAWGIIPKVAVSYSGTYVVGNAVLGWYLTGRNLSPKQMRELSVQSFARGKELARKLGEKFPKPKLGKRKRPKLQAPPAKPELIQGETVISTNNEPALEKLSIESGEVLIQDAHVQIEPIQKATDMKGKAAERKPPRTPRRKFVWRREKPSTQLQRTRICPQCGKNSSEDAGYCQYCGYQFDR